MFKRLLLTTLVFGTTSCAAFKPSPVLRCRGIAITKDMRTYRGPWVKGLNACSDLKSDMKFSNLMFGKDILFGLELQAAGQTLALWLSDPQPPSGDPLDKTPSSGSYGTQQLEVK